MIDELIISALGLKPTGAHMGTSFVHNCEIMTWPIEGSDRVYVMDCNSEGEPLREGFYRILATSIIGEYKWEKDCLASKDALLNPCLRESIAKEIVVFND